MCVPLPIIVHVTGEKLTENGPLLRAPSAFLGSFVSVLAVGLTRTLNALILPLKSHIPQFTWRWQDHVGWNKLPTDPSSPDLSLACYSNQHHRHCAPPSRRKADLRQGHLRAGAPAAVQKEVTAWRDSVLHTCSSRSLSSFFCFTVDLPFSGPKGRTLLHPSNLAPTPQPLMSRVRSTA